MSDARSPATVIYNPDKNRIGRFAKFHQVPADYLAPAEIVIVGELVRVGAFPLIDAELRRGSFDCIAWYLDPPKPDLSRLRSGVALVRDDKAL